MASGSSRRSARASSRPIGKRRRAREMAVQMLYQQELGRTTLEQVFASFDLSDYLSETEVAQDGDGAGAGAAPPPSDDRRKRAQASFEYARSLVVGSLDHSQEIDERIRRHAENWRLERMPAIDRNILRLAIYEMLHVPGVPKVVIVDEAIELAKKFGSENSGRFVNGLLDGVLKASRAEARSPAAASAEPTVTASGASGEER